jgi:hypothetical protein
MKPLIIASLAILLASGTIQAQSDYATVKKDIKQSNKEESSIKKEKKEERKALRKLEGQEPSYQSREQFAQDFDQVSNVEWKRTRFFDEATFTKDEKTMTAFYDYENKLVGTTEVKAFTDLPASAQKTINKKYKDYSVQKVIMFDDNEDNDTDMLLYGHQFDDADNYFVELQQGNKAIIVQVDMIGDVSFFTTMQ